MTRRLLFSYLTVTLVVLVLLELPLAIFFQQRELDRLTVDAERDATVLATIYEDSLEKDLPADPTSAADYSVDTAARVVVVDADGISVVDTAREVHRDFSTRPEIEIALSGERSTGTRRSDTLDTDLLFVAVPVASGGTVHGALRITLGTGEVTERIWRFWLGLVAIAVVILTVMGGVGWIIARSITRPIRRLEAAATRFSGGDLTPTSSGANAPRELVALEAAMNDMASRLDVLIERQRAFASDVSHQLRTPLTALRLRLENLQFDNPTKTRELDNAINETTRLSALVDDLLRLARTEHSLPSVDVNLTELVRDRVDVWTATAEQNEITLDLVTDNKNVHASATPGGIEQILDNLLDNALRAAPEGSSVVVTVTARADGRTVSIADSGGGLSDEDKEHALNRFWRADDSTPGTGLGLAIADTILKASGGSIELTDNTPTGLVVTVTLPAM